MSLITYSSQYVDDNTDRYHKIEVEGKEFEKKIDPIIGKGSKRFHTIMTQLADINLSNVTKPFDFDIQRFVYAPFHFIPAEHNINKSEIKKIKEKMGLYNPLTTFQDCKNARDLVEESIKSKDLYQIGISLHVYADTWSHSRFSGFQEPWNGVEKGISLMKLVPNIGHAELKHKPDIISKSWKDKRFGEKVSNKTKALRASEEIFKFLSDGKKDWIDIKSDFKKIIFAKDYSERVSLILNNYPDLNRYKEDLWINEPFDFKLGPDEVILCNDPEEEEMAYSTHQVIEVTPKANFEKTNWYKFQTAAKRFLGRVISKVEML